MTKRSPRAGLAALMVLIPGAIGLYIVARTLFVYWGRDLPASVIVLAMALALAFGLVELLLRQHTAGQLEREVGALPHTPSETTVDLASPLLSGLLRARLEQAPASGLGDSVAPFITGLLVMLGLLGTLLGLFETVRGASLALTSSTDVDALRRSLTTPIEGLTRSFGCSAAGISASAMLGLAVALVRRGESRVLRAVQSYASGPLRVLSPVRRQARAIEQLASQGAALPAASAALEKVGLQLSALSERMVGLQTSSLDAQKAAMAELFGSLRRELGEAASEAGGALQQHVAPLLQQSLTRMDETVQRQAVALAEVGRELARELTADAATRRSEASAWISSVGARLDEAERERSTAQAAELSALTALTTKSLGEAEARERASAERFRELAAKVEQQSAASQAREGERLARLEALSERVGTGLDGLTQRIGANLDALAQRLGDDLARLSTELGSEHTERRAIEHAHDERARVVAEQLSLGAKALGEGIVRQEGALERLVERLPPLFSEVAEASQTHAHGALDKLVAATDERLAQVSKLLQIELEERLASERAHDERARAALARLELSAGLLDASIARQDSGAEQLVQRVGVLVSQLTAAAQHEAEATLARLAESADAQAARFAQLSQALESGRAEHALGLHEQLSGHAQQLEERLAKTSALVQDAAASWQASTVEMQAVADVFAKSVDRQREASDAWLESLGEVEGAVERAGRHAAKDALSDQLASTQEVFARQLQFQRELFEQLRSLRAVAPRSGHGEQDVSV